MMQENKAQADDGIHSPPKYGDSQETKDALDRMVELARKDDNWAVCPKCSHRFKAY